MKNWQECLELQGIAPRYYNTDFKNHPAIKPHWNEILEFAKKPEGNIFMAGACGNGKTMNAVAIMAACLVFRGPGARYFNAETLYQGWRRESKQGDPAYYAEKLSDSPVLVLDDLGQGEITDAFKRWVYSLINKRWEWEKPTVVTTNLNSEEFRNLYGDAILSRLMDGKVWKFDGRDYRLPNNRNEMA